MLPPKYWRDSNISKPNVLEFTMDLGFRSTRRRMDAVQFDTMHYAKTWRLGAAFWGNALYP